MARKKNTGIYVAALLLFLGGVGYLVYSGFSENSVYFLNVSEAQAATPDKLASARLFGTVAPEGIEKASAGTGVNFLLADKDNAGQAIAVRYSGTVPDTFKAGAAVARHLTGMVNGFILKLKDDETALREEKNKLDDAYKELERVAYYDFLTGLLNRRAMYERLEKEFSRAQREGLQFCLVLADIDHFKVVNDTYGHDAGDVVLQSIAEIFQNNIRQEDCASRWGGEEFLILAISCGLEDGLSLAEKLRKAVEDTPIRIGAAIINVTITLGVVEYTKGKSFSTLIKEADFYLYEGKRQRNCVMSSSGTAKEPLE